MRAALASANRTGALYPVPVSRCCWCCSFSLRPRPQEALRHSGALLCVVGAAALASAAPAGGAVRYYQVAAPDYYYKTEASHFWDLMQKKIKESGRRCISATSAWEPLFFICVEPARRCFVFVVVLLLLAPAAVGGALAAASPFSAGGSGRDNGCFEPLRRDGGAGRAHAPPGVSLHGAKVVLCEAFPRSSSADDLLFFLTSGR